MQSVNGLGLKAGWGVKKNNGVSSMVIKKSYHYSTARWTSCKKTGGTRFFTYL